MNEKERKRLAWNIAHTQPLLQEEVLAVCPFLRVGTLAEISLLLTLYPAGVAQGRRVTQKAGGLPKNGLLAVTPKHIYPYVFRATLPPYRKLNLLAKWPRDAVQVDAPEGTRSKRVTFRFPETGQELQLDLAVKGQLGIGEEFLRVLLETPPEAGNP